MAIPLYYKDFLIQLKIDGDSSKNISIKKMIFDSVYGITRFIKIGNAFTMIRRVKSKTH